MSWDKEATRTKRQIEAVAEKAKESSNEPRFIQTMSPGDMVRQGDVYVLMLDGAPSVQWRGAKPQARQVAVGQTVGARHIAVEGVVEEKVVDPTPGGKDSSLKVWPSKLTGPLQGPYVEATERWTLAHPEHANVIFPAGWFEVRYQPDARTGEAVFD